MAEYTPSDGDVRWQYVVKRMHDGATWMHADQEYTRWLAAHEARVRRDAARSALDGLAEHANRTANERRSPQAVNRWDDIWRETRKYRATHYPETEDQT